MYYSQYIVLIEIFHWLGWHLAYSLIKLFHWQSEALHWQDAQELLLWKCWVCGAHCALEANDAMQSLDLQIREIFS